MLKFWQQYRLKILPLLAVFIFLGFIFLISPLRKKEMAWKTVSVEQAKFRLTIQASGTMDPENRIVVMAPVAGRVEEILVKEGDKVRRGSTIAWMSSTDRAALLDMAETQGRSSRKKWEKQYLPTPILSPVDGIIIKRDIVPGQTINQQSNLFEICDHLIIRAEVDETDISKVHAGQRTEIKVDAYPDAIIQGKVKEIAHQSKLSNNVTTYDVAIDPMNLPQEIRSGMTVSVNFIVQEVEKAKLLPSWIASGFENSEVEVFVRNAVGMPEKRKILVGNSNGQKVEVLRGIDAQDVVMYLPVKILQESKSPLGLFRSKPHE